MKKLLTILFLSTVLISFASAFDNETADILIGDSKIVEKMDWAKVLDNLEQEFRARKMPKEAHAVSLENG